MSLFLFPSEHATLLQRQPNVVQTPWTFGQRCVDVVLTSHFHSVMIADSKRNVVSFLHDVGGIKGLR